LIATGAVCWSGNSHSTEIPFRLGGEEVWPLVYVLIEHQSGDDPVMPLGF
jgi:hypothetical protein